MSCLLIITNQYDATTDLLIRELDCSSIFRFNFDRFTDYALRWGRQSFCITDPTGRRADLEGITKAYWRKPFQGDSSGNPCYNDIELRYILRELVNLLWSAQKFTLVEPFAEQRIGKLLQLHHAGDYFHTPPYEIVLNQRSELSRDVVVKSLSSQLNEGKALFTTRVRVDQLDYQHPWFLQAYVRAAWDVTAVFVMGRIFSFDLKRDFLSKTVDWREIPPDEQTWQPHTLPNAMTSAIREYMQVLRLDYGRLDFLLDESGQYWFCEVNPNGQFGWLDLDAQFGLLDCVLEAISPDTPQVPLSNSHPLQPSIPANGARP